MAKHYHTRFWDWFWHDVSSLRFIRNIPAVKKHIIRHRFDLVRWALFHIQILIAVYIFTHQVSDSGELVNNALEIGDLSAISYHYLKILLLAFNIPFSLLVAVAHWYGWADDIEKELTEVYAYISWLIILFIEIFT